MDPDNRQAHLAGCRYTVLALMTVVVAGVAIIWNATGDCALGAPCHPHAIRNVAIVLVALAVFDLVVGVLLSRIFRKRRP